MKSFHEKALLFLLTSHALYFFTSDSVFEDEGAETPPTTAQPAEDGDKPETNPNPAESAVTEGEDKEQHPAQMHSETGQDLLAVILFSCSCWQQCFPFMVMI